MKNITLTLSLFILLLQFSHAQTNTFPTSGNVGIGTLSPVNNLQIGTQTPTATAAPLTMSLGATYSTTAGANPKIKFYDDGTGPYGFGISASQMDAIVPVGGSFAWYVNGSQKMLLNSSGNVGIGTTSPGELLDVTGNPVFGTSTERLSMGSGSFGFNRRVATGSLYDNTRFAYQFQHTGSTTATSDYLAFQVYNPSGGNVTPNALVINGSAQVGINTTYIPSAYQMAINGSLIATSVTVQLRTNWPDYVFKPTYHLLSLTDTKTYIDLNHHLPEIPSEQQIAKDGLNLGEMNKLLVKKVEELTLYLIEKDKEIKGQQEQLELIKKELQILIDKKSDKN
jgi:hypothetical protein